VFSILYRYRTTYDITIQYQKNRKDIDIGIFMGGGGLAPPTVSPRASRYMSAPGMANPPPKKNRTPYAYGYRYTEVYRSPSLQLITNDLCY